MHQAIEELLDKWGEHFEMIPKKQRWEAVARLLADEVIRQRQTITYLERTENVRHPTKHA